MSLKNLGLETMDVQQFHVCQDEWVGEGDRLFEIENEQTHEEPGVLIVQPG